MRLFLSGMVVARLDRTLRGIAGLLTAFTNPALSSISSRIGTRQVDRMVT